ncbi:MAG TPA: deoxyribonuclease V [Chloroflexia bacterium]|nr:deoxyribonuclease V [Chloroflexia bacterium]
MHRWDVSPAEAIAIQEQLRPLVRQTTTFALEDIRTVAGVDVSYRDVARAAVVVLARPGLERIDQSIALRPSTFPYVPGLFSFREAPAVLDALARLQRPPDLLICDGHGYAHPRRFGLACHLGVYLDRPCIGCAKSRLVGTHAAPGPNPGDWTPLVDDGETIGAVLRTKRETKPLYVSVGHRIDLAMAVAVVLDCLRGYRLPEPTRLADILAHPAAAGSPPVV